MKVTNEKELAKAIENNENIIEIEGDLSKKILKIKATGKVAWAIAFCAIAASVALVISSIGTGGISSVGIVATAPTAVGILGVGATSTAIAIAIAAGGVGVLKKLRNYKLEKISEKHIRLIK